MLDETVFLSAITGSASSDSKLLTQMPATDKLAVIMATNDKDGNNVSSNQGPNSQTLS